MNNKQCRYCSEWYPEAFFGVAATYPNKVYRRHKCKFCYGNTKNKLVKQHRQWIIDYKRRRSCSHCGISDYRVLDFHHKKGEEKDFELGSYHRIGFKRIKKEVEKCILLCANCHRIAHFESE